MSVLRRFPGRPPLAVRAVSALAALAACAPAPDRTPTFARDVAPIVFENCSVCHHAGGNTPFSFVSYDDVRRRARQVAEVTQSGFMPPWPPQLGDRPFLRERRLSAEQIDTLQRWVDGGALEGDLLEMPPVPEFDPELDQGWQLGEPDLVIEMPEPYVLAAGGPDVYRNFVIRSPVSSARWVRTIEFRPGNSRVVHHAFVLIDPTEGSYRQDEQDPQPGFDGIHPPESATVPSGFFLSWTPGREPFEGIDGMAWPLERGTDIVIQLHMQPSGKPEQVRSQVALYFADGPPQRHPYKIGMFTTEIDIPAGEADYVVEASFRVPVDVDVLAVLPHAHFLGKSMWGFADLPGGERLDLIRIPEWDFNWQADYRYVEPLFLPRGTELGLRFVYDNSAANVRNPHFPPRRVTYGLQSSDEMCEFWLQVVPRDPTDFDTLRQSFEQVMAAQVAVNSRRAIEGDPGDAQAHVRLGQALLAGKDHDAALVEFRTALEVDPAAVDAHLFSAVILSARGETEAAREELQRAIGVRPDDARLHFALGSLHYQAGELAPAGACYQEAVRLDPDDFRANLQLGVVHARTGRLDLAIVRFEHCVALRPTDADARKNLEQARRMRERQR